MLSGKYGNPDRLKNEIRRRKKYVTEYFSDIPGYPGERRRTASVPQEKGLSSGEHYALFPPEDVRIKESIQERMGREGVPGGKNDGMGS